MNGRIQHAEPIRPDSHQNGRPTVRKAGDRWAVTWIRPVRDGQYQFVAITRAFPTWSSAIAAAVGAVR